MDDQTKQGSDRVPDPGLGTGTVLANTSLEPLSGSSFGGPPSSTNSSCPPELLASNLYTDVRELGRGGMGVVYVAQNAMMHRPEVLKIVNKALLDRPGAVDQFLREIRAAAKLRHPNVVVAYAAHQIGNLLVFAMEYVDGTDLSQLVKQRGPLPVPNACFYIFQAALGLQHAHEKEMVHRDIKPSNLILTREGKKQVVKVLDFGLAKGTGERGVEESISEAGKVVMCTPDYVSPEQIKDSSRADARSDIYSLGCTLYFLLAGRVPFPGKDIYEVLAAHRNEKAPRLSEIRADVPDGLSGLVAKMMAKDPAHRFQTPADVAAALKPYFRPGVDAEVVVSSIVLTPITHPPAGADEEPAKPSARSTRAIADESTPTVKRRPRPASRKKKSSFTTFRMAAQVVGGFLVLALFIAWSAGAFKGIFRAKGDEPPRAGRTNS